jgi:hypothetical protein
MANKDNKNGLRPCNFPEGERRRIATIEPSTTTEIRIGDPVTRIAGNTVNRATAGAGNMIAGVADSIEDDTGVKRIYYPAVTPAKSGWKVTYLCHPDQEYECQEDNDGGGTLGDASVGKNVDIAYGALPDAEINPKSQALLDTSSVGTGATLQCRIVDTSRRVDNDTTAVNAKYIVKINYNQEIQGTGV